MADLSPRDEDVPQLPAFARTSPPAGAYVARTQQATAADRAEICNGIMLEAEGSGYWGAGYASTSRTGITIANSAGALASFDGSDAQSNVKVIASDSSGFAEHYSTDIRSLDGHVIGARAAQKARATAHPRSVEPGEWTVILEPPAFGELLAYLCGHFSAQAFEEGSSFFAGALGKRFFDPSVTITDDYSHPLMPGMPFDFEGQPKTILPLVEGGFVKNIVTDSYYAKKLGRPNTGHALPAPNAYGPHPLNIVVSAGSQSLDDLISSTQRGLLISRFWYIRTVDYK